MRKYEDKLDASKWTVIDEATLTFEPNIIRCMKRLKYLIPSLFLISTLGYWFIDSSAPYMVIKPRRHTDGPTPESIGLKAEHIQLQVADTIALSALYMPAIGRDTPLSTVILLHGIGNNKEAWVETAALLNTWGHAALLYDSRAHGGSQGEYCTLGFYEKQDVSRAIDWLDSHHPTARVGIMGNSMGGAVALQALAVEPRLRYGVIYCAFADLASVVKAYQKRYAQGLAFDDFTEESLVEAGKIAHFDPAQVCPVCVAPQITQPIFMMHGSEDVNINPNDMEKIYHALGSQKKEKTLVSGADHYTITQVGGEPLLERMKAFMAENSKQE
jgi:uncharacterized protein